MNSAKKEPWQAEWTEISDIDSISGDSLGYIEIFFYMRVILPSDHNFWVYSEINLKDSGYECLFRGGLGFVLDWGEDGLLPISRLL